MNSDGLGRTETPAESRFLLRFRLADDLRFVSHLDLMRLFERACRRAGLPLKFSQGFNPRPAVNLPVPHSVGIAGADEPLLIELLGAFQAEPLPAALNAQLPPEAAVESVRPLEPGEKLRPEWAEYRAVLPADCPAVAPDAAERLLAGDSIAAVRRRRDGGPDKPLDIRRFVLELKAENGIVHMRLAVTDSGSAKPVEVLEALGVPDDCVGRTDIVRTAVHLRSEFRRQQERSPTGKAAERQTECPQQRESTENESGGASGGAETEEAVDIDGPKGGSPALPDC